MPCSVVAQDEVPWLSLSRLFLSASSSYHFSPWKKYNESLQLAQDAIRYDSYYAAPKGSFEKILGDGTVELNLGYRLIEGLSVNIIGGYTATSSQVNFSNTEYYISYPEETRFPVENAINQKIELNIISVGFSLQYNFKITDGIKLVALASACENYATFNFEYEYHRASERFLYSVELQDTKYSFRTGFGFLVDLYGPFSLSSSVEYRWLRFPDFQGDGTYLEQHILPYFSDEHSESFQALLGESEGYFGIHSVRPTGTIINERLLHILWQRTSVGTLWYQTKKPATLDLSGIGIKLGVQFEF